MKLSECAQVLGGQLVGKDANFDSIAIAAVDRPIVPQSLVVPTAEQPITEEYLSQCAQAKASSLLVASLPSTSLPKNLSALVVPNLAVALLKLAAVWRAQFPIPVICVSGSSGKTTTTSLISHLLAARYRVLDSPRPEKSYNTLLSLPWILLGLTPEHDVAVLEVEYKGAKYMRLLSSLVKPQIGIITNVQLETWNGKRPIERLAKEKGALLTKLTRHGVGIINTDDAFAADWERCLGRRTCIRFGIQNQDADVVAKKIKLDAMGHPSFELVVANEALPISLKLLGYHNVYNALAATAAALAMGIPLNDIQAGLNSFQPVKWRLQRYQAPNGATIIDDTFNSNPPAVFAAIELLAHQAGEKILVITDMSSGKTAEEISYHTRIGKMAKQAGIHQLYGLGPLCAHAANAFGKKGFYFLDQENFINALKQAISPKSTALFKGRPLCGIVMRELVAALT